MSILVVLLPARPRGDGDSAPAPPGPATEYGFLLSPDGLAASAQGRAAPSTFPRADQVVAVVHDHDVAWHRLTLPKAPGAKMRAALSGLLEEQLLDETDQSHFALAPDARSGETAWVSVTHREWLSAHLAVLERAGVAVDRVVPFSSPDDIAYGHFLSDEDGDGSLEHTRLVLADASGVQCIGLGGGLARALVSSWVARSARFSASPAVAAQAERWLGTPVRVLTDGERALQATRSLWNLRQFDLAARHRGALALRDAAKRWRRPEWRAFRQGLLGLALVQVIGLNLWAWHQSRAIDERRAAMDALLREAFPNVRAVLDAPVQMQREVDRLRAAAGRTGDADLEPLLAAAAQSWPRGQAPVESLRYEPGRLVLAARGWNGAQLADFENRLRAGGLRLEQSEGRLTISRAAPRSSGT